MADDILEKASPRIHTRMIPGRKNPGQGGEDKANYNSYVYDVARSEIDVIEAFFAEKKVEEQYKERTEHYTVVKNDTLNGIADKHGVDQSAVQRTKDTRYLQIGETVIVTKKEKIGETITYQPIKSASIGEEVYVVIKTAFAKGKSLKINIIDGKKGNLYGRGEFNPIQVLQGEEEKVGLEATVGDDNMAVIKVKLRPEDDGHLQKWKNNINASEDKKAYLCILVDAHTPNAGVEVKYRGKNENGTEDSSKGNIRNYWLDIEGKWFELSNDKKAPWMVFAEQEYETYKGINENTSPLKERIAEYLNTTNAAGNTHTTPWCGAFVNWCFNQTEEYKNTNTGLNALAFDWGTKEVADKSRHKPDGWVDGETCEAFYGAVIVLSYSHTAFIVGKNSSSNKYVYLGGNQGGSKSGEQQICYGTVTIGKELSIMKPKGYNISEKEKELEEMTVNADGSYDSTR